MVFTFKLSISTEYFSYYYSEDDLTGAGLFLETALFF
jgi:hypothetical protein